MKANPVLDKVQAVVEYLIALVFASSAIQLFFVPSIVGKGILGFLGTHVALLVYAVWFIFWALALLYSKIAKRKKLHRNVLMVLYLTTVYTAALTIAIYGFPDAIDDIVVGLVIAGCWLRWKFRTEYLDPNEFKHDVRHFDGPPPPP